MPIYASEDVKIEVNISPNGIKFDNSAALRVE